MLTDLLSLTSSLEDYKIILALIPIIIGMRAFPLNDKKLKVFYILVCFTALIVFTGIVTSGLGNNVYILYIFAPIEAILLAYVLFPEKKHKRIRTLALIAISTAIAMNFVEAFFFKGGVAFYNSTTYTIINLSLGILAIRQLILLRFDPKVLSLTSEPLFWIALSVAIYKFGTLINWIFFRTIQVSGDDAIIVMTFLGTVISYSTFFFNSLALWKVKNK